MKTETVKDEAIAMEQRLSELKADIAAFSKRKETIERESGDMMARTTAECEKRIVEARQNSARINQESSKLIADKAEFQAILAAFKQEKLSFEKTRIEALDMKENYRKMKEKIDYFQLTVRRAYELI